MKFDPQRLAALAALALSGLAGTAHADPRPFTAKDLATLDRVSDPLVSPDGKYVVYDLRTVDYAADTSAHALWLVERDTPGATPRRLAASDGGASDPHWAPDSRTLYFTSARAGGTQIWRTDPGGMSASQVTRLPLDVGAFRIAPDGKTIVLALAVFPDCDTVQCTKARLDAKGTEKATGILYDRLFIRHWDSWADGTRNQLWAMKLDAKGDAAGAPAPLMEGFDGDSPTTPFGGDEDFAISPDGKSVVFSAKLAGRTEPWSTNYDLWQAPLDGGAPPRDITPDNPAWDAGPVFSPDGTRLAWRAMKRPGFEADRYGIMVRTLETGETHAVAPGWDRSPESLEWSKDGRTLYATADDLGQTRLFGVDVASGAVSPLTGDGHVAGFDVTPDGIVYARGALDSPDQLYRIGLAGGAATELTRADDAQLKDVAFGAYEPFSFAGWNGETVHGIVVKPFGFQAGRKYPVALIIHGGPQAALANLFHYRWNAQVFAGAGYGVVMIDFHGTPGYGQGFTDSISQHWGDRPLEDLQKGWAAALARYPFLDGGRACALGGSYGGFMVNWIAGNWSQPFKCLVDHDGVFDTRMMAYSTDELWFEEWENGGLPWEHPENYERFNPADHVADWKLPELVIHGGHDFRIPDDQGIATFTALQRKGIPSELLYFPDENHWVLKPQNAVEWYDTVLGWLGRWTGGK